MLVLTIPAALAFVAIVRWPVFGAWLFLALTPLIVGIARGAMSGVLRPNELLLLLLVAASGVRIVLLALSQHYRLPRFDRMDLLILGLIATGSLMPLAWLMLRGLKPTQDDILYAAVFWKYYVLYRIFRGAVITPRQVGSCLVVSLATGAIVGAVAILQVSGLFGVGEFLHSFYDQPFEGYAGVMAERGTSTISSAFGLGDVMTMNLIIALHMLHRGLQPRALLYCAAALFVFGVVAAGEISGYVGLLVTALAYGAVSRTLHRLLPAGLAALGVAVIPLWSVVGTRLSGFSGSSGVPNSWTMRWQNLSQFFIPPLFDENGWILGVQPAARVLAPEKWRLFVYIESGYLWLLWTGGIPLLIAYVTFLVLSVRTLRRVVQARSDAVSTAAMACLCYIATLSVLSLFDPHLTMRGTADLFFPLLALSRVGDGVQQTSSAWAAMKLRAAASRLSQPTGIAGALR
jgi:hypothetical protein